MAFVIRNEQNFLNNLGDKNLELTDPTPDIWHMFHDFDLRFFNGTLDSNGVSVSWSSKMTLCAGLCRFHPRTRACEIKLSKPLLQLRTRKDLVETLIHEMIHALLFVVGDTDNRESHGPKFHQYMYKINYEACLNITVFHSFHQEVNHFKTHVWRCDGDCKNRPPYFGYVRRAMNRKPGPSDNWWAQHQRSCAGKFIKISEPEKKDTKKKENKNGVENKIKDIRTFFSPTKSNAKIAGFNNDTNIVSLNSKSEVEVFQGEGNLLGGSDIKNPNSGKSILLTIFNNNSTNNRKSINSTVTSSTITSNVSNKLNNTLNNVFKGNSSSDKLNFTSNTKSNVASNVSSNNKSNFTPNKSNITTSSSKSSTFNSDKSNNLTTNKFNTKSLTSNDFKDTNDKSSNSIVVLDDKNYLKRPTKKSNKIEVVNLESPIKKLKSNKEPVLIDDEDEDFSWLNQLSDKDLLKISQDHSIVIDDDDEDFSWLNELSDKDLLKISQDHSIVIDDDEDEYSWLNNISNEDLMNSSKTLSNSIVID